MAELEAELRLIGCVELDSLENTPATPRVRTQPSVLGFVLSREPRTRYERKLLEVVLRMVEHAIEAHGGSQGAAMALGVSSRTLRRWVERFPRLKT